MLIRNGSFFIALLAIILVCPKGQAQIEVVVGIVAGNREQHKRDCQAADEQYNDVSNRISIKSQAVAAANNAVNEANARITAANQHETQTTQNIAQLKKLYSSLERVSQYSGQWTLLLSSVKEHTRGDQPRLSSWKEAVDSLSFEIQKTQHPVVPQEGFFSSLFSRDSNEIPPDQMVKRQLAFLKLLSDSMDASMKSASGDLKMYSGDTSDPTAMLVGLAQLVGDLSTNLQKQEDQNVVEIKTATDAKATRDGQYGSLAGELSQLNVLRADIAHKQCH